MKQLVSRYRRIALVALPLVAAWLLALGSAWLLLGGLPVPGAVLAVLLLVFLWWQGQRDRDVSAPAAVVTLALAVEAGRAGSTPWLPVAGSAVLLAVMAAPFADRVLRPRLSAHRLPGLQVPFPGTLRRPVLAAGCAGGVVLALASAGLLAPPVTVVLVLLVLAAGAVVAAVQLLRVRRHLAEREIRAALDDYAPDYYVYFSGRSEAAYQVQMWLPHLERTGTRGALLIRERSFLATALRVSTLPVLLVEAVEPIEHVIVPSLGAIFYVNNAAKNVDGTRYAQVTHVHLGHGDSDKPPSYAASTAMFDRIFVAGQAGVDRFASHGVLVPAEKFVLVGRPQVEAIQVRAGGTGPGGTPPHQRPVVLYAPTYRGTLGDMQLSSLAEGERIVAAILASGAAVIFRPHPFTQRDAASRVLVKRIDDRIAADAGTGHLTSDQAVALSVFECINASDALVGDVSSVVSDYLYSNKPIALAHRAGDRVEAEYPLARGTLLLDLDGDLAAPIADLLGADPRAAERAEVRSYYLGPWPPEEYAQVFVDAALRVIREGRTGRR